MRPITLSANLPRTFYRGAGRIHALRGIPAPADPYRAEDWIASTTSRFGRHPAGMSTIDGGELLAEAIEEDPEGWLGAAHVAVFGHSPGILVKLLDAGERLPLHVHPDRRFARSHLASPYGKTEAWVIASAEPNAAVHIGFARDVSPDEVAGWVTRQESAAMLAATNRVPVSAGDVVVCPAGVPHAIGEGILLVEIQEPTDFSVLLEWEGFDVDGPAEGHLGLGFDLALQCVDRSAWSEQRLTGLWRRRPTAGVRPGVERLFPELADPFFAAERLRPDPVSVLDPSFSVVVVLAGDGGLETAAGHREPLTRGRTVVVPHSAGECRVTGQVDAIRCLPGGGLS